MPDVILLLLNLVANTHHELWIFCSFQHLGYYWVTWMCNYFSLVSLSLWEWKKAPAQMEWSCLGSWATSSRWIIKHPEAGSSVSFGLVPTSFEVCSVGCLNIAVVNIVVDSVWWEYRGLLQDYNIIYTNAWIRLLTEEYLQHLQLWLSYSRDVYISFISVSSKAFAWWLYCARVFEFGVQDMNSFDKFIPLTSWLIICDSQFYSPGGLLI